MATRQIIGFDIYSKRMGGSPFVPFVNPRGIRGNRGARTGPEGVLPQKRKLVGKGTYTPKVRTAIHDLRVKPKPIRRAYGGRRSFAPQGWMR